MMKIKKANLIVGDRFSDCRFIQCDFSGVALTKKHFSTCFFEQCSLVSVSLNGTRFFDVTFTESKLMGIDFTVCDPTFLALNFERCVLRGCNFTELKLKGARFTQSKVKQCHFAQADLEGVDFSDCDLEETIFHHTNLKNGNFKGAINYQIDVAENRIQKARFSKLEALSLLESLGIKLE